MGRTSFAARAATIAVATILTVPRRASADSPFQALTYANDRRVTGAEVCFFKARSPRSFTDRFLGASDTQCYAADRIARIPAGTWNFYIQHPDYGVSTHPYAFGAIEHDDDNAKPVRIDLLPAGVLDLTAARSGLQSGEHFALYISNGGRAASPPAMRPFPRDATRFLAPADMQLLLLIVRESTIVWAGRPFTIPARQVFAVPLPHRPSRDLIALVGIDDAVTPYERNAVQSIAPPTLRLRSKTVDRTTALGLKPPPAFDTSIVTFEDVPPGDYTLELSGQFWLGDRLAVHVDAPTEVIAQASRSLLTQPRARIDATWTIGGDLAATPSAPTCDGAKPAETALTLFRCAFPFPRCAPGDRAVVKRLDLNRDVRGRTSFDELEPGDYYVQLERADLRAFGRAAARIAVASAVDLKLEPVVVTGRVTQASKPVKANIEFATGSVVSDGETGEYYALLTRPPGAQPIRVTVCGSEKAYLDVPPRALVASDRYEIDIPANHLVVQVVDAATNTPLAKARVNSRPVTERQDLEWRLVGVTSDEGVVRDENVSKTATLEVCAAAPGYDRQCSSNVRMRTETETITLALPRSSKRTVRIAWDHDMGGGMVFVVFQGSVIAQSPIDPRKMFQLDPTTPSDADVYIAAPYYPLTRLPVPNLVVDDPVLELPSRSSVSFSVTLPRNAKHAGGSLGIEMGGSPVPSDVLRYFQMIANQSSPEIRPGDTVQFGAIDASAPTTVLLWHWVMDIPSQLTFPDPFVVPTTLRLMYRAPVTGPQVVLVP
jgi:hypothetical protein